MQNIREAPANTAASAKAGLDKTKATVQEKVDRMSTHDPVQKEMAAENKEMRKAEAEANKQAAREQNAASKMAAQAGAQPQYATGGDSYTHTATGVPGYRTGSEDMPGGQLHGGHVDSPGIGHTRPTGLAGDGTGYNTSVESMDPNDGTGAVPPTRFNYR